MNARPAARVSQNVGQRHAEHLADADGEQVDEQRRHEDARQHHAER